MPIKVYIYTALSLCKYILCLKLNKFNTLNLIRNKLINLSHIILLSASPEADESFMSDASDSMRSTQSERPNRSARGFR